MNACCLSLFAPEPSGPLNVWIDSPHWACLQFGFRHFPISARSALGLRRGTKEINTCSSASSQRLREPASPEPAHPRRTSSRAASPPTACRFRLCDGQCGLGRAPLLAEGSSPPPPVPDALSVTVQGCMFGSFPCWGVSRREPPRLGLPSLGAGAAARSRGFQTRFGLRRFMPVLPYLGIFWLLLRKDWGH